MADDKYGAGGEKWKVKGMSDDRENRFVEEYLIDLNATQAYIRAGYSPKRAKANAARLMAKERVRVRVGEAIAERSRRTGISADRVLREYARIAFYNPSKFINLETGVVKENATEDDLAVIASVKVKSWDKGTEREIRFHDKNKALEKLAEHLDMKGEFDAEAGAKGIVMMPAVLPEQAPEVQSDEAGN